MDLFAVVQLNRPRDVAVSTRALREDEEPLLASTAGRVMEMVLDDPDNSGCPAVVATPVQSVPSGSAQPVEAELISSDSSSEPQLEKVVSETEEEPTVLKRKRPAGGDGAGTSKRRRQNVLFGSSEEETEESLAIGEKDATKSPFYK